MMRVGAQQRRARRVLGVCAACGACTAAAAAAPGQAPPRAVVVHDAVDTPGGLDLTRVQLGRASDGRLRAALTLAAPWRLRDLPAGDGPPGSLCLRMWTVSRPLGDFPDYLLCLTADARARHIRASVLVDRDGTLLRVAGATLARSSTRSVVVRFSPGAIGTPRSIRFAAEATTPGCRAPACVDTAPDAPVVARLRLRSA